MAVSSKVIDNYLRIQEARKKKINTEIHKLYFMYIILL